MAKETIVRLIDDLDGTPIDDGGSTVQFALEGRAYEIDLSPSNIEKLRAALGPFVSSGRLLSGRRNSTSTGGRSRAARSNGSSSLSAIREWARENGHAINERGRVPQAITEAYEAAQRS